MILFVTELHITGFQHDHYLFFEQVDPCFYLTKEFYVFSVEMVTIGGRKKMEELWEKHMNDLRYVESICGMMLIMLASYMPLGVGIC